MDIKPVTPPKSEKPLFISMYDKGYMRVNKSLTDLLGLQEGDRVGFYINPLGNYLFGKLKDGYKLRCQANVTAMFFNAKAMSDTFRSIYDVPGTGVAKLTLRAEPKILIEDEQFVLITNDPARAEEASDKPVRGGAVIGETNQGELDN